MPAQAHLTPDQDAWNRFRNRYPFLNPDIATYEKLQKKGATLPPLTGSRLGRHITTGEIMVTPDVRDLNRLPVFLDVIEDIPCAVAHWEHMAHDPEHTCAVFKLTRIPYQRTRANQKRRRVIATRLPRSNIDPAEIGRIMTYADVTRYHRAPKKHPGHRNPGPSGHE
jgi:hypothetical protein